MRVAQRTQQASAGVASTSYRSLPSPPPIYRSSRHSTPLRCQLHSQQLCVTPQKASRHENLVSVLRPFIVYASYFGRLSIVEAQNEVTNASASTCAAPTTPEGLRARKAHAAVHVRSRQCRLQAKGEQGHSGARGWIYRLHWQVCGEGADKEGLQCSSFCPREERGGWQGFNGRHYSGNWLTTAHASYLYIDPLLPVSSIISFASSHTTHMLQEFKGADVKFGDVQDMESLRTIGFAQPVDVVVSCLASRTGGKAGQLPPLHSKSQHHMRCK